MKTLDITINATEFYGVGDNAAPLHETDGYGEMYSAKLLLSERGYCELVTRQPADRGTPEGEWNGRTQAWDLPGDIRGSVLEALLTAPETLQLLQRVYNGHTVDWNGQNNVGTLDDDAEDAHDTLSRLFSDLRHDAESTWNIFEAGDYLSQNSLDEVWPAGVTLEKAAEAIVGHAADAGTLCGHAGEVESALLDMLEEALKAEDFEPTAEQLEARGR